MTHLTLTDKQVTMVEKALDLYANATWGEETEDVYALLFQIGEAKNGTYS